MLLALFGRCSDRGIRMFIVLHVHGSCIFITKVCWIVVGVSSARSLVF
jgi:hypothetical protein